MIASESVKALRSVQQRGPKIVTMHPTYFIYNRVGKLKIFDIHVYISSLFSLPKRVVKRRGVR